MLRFCMATMFSHCAGSISVGCVRGSIISALFSLLWITLVCRALFFHAVVIVGMFFLKYCFVYSIQLFYLLSFPQSIIIEVLFVKSQSPFWYMSKKVRCSHIKICVFLLLINKSRKVLSLKPRKLICSAVQTYPIICRKQNFNVNWLTLLEPVFIDIILTVIKD